MNNMRSFSNLFCNNPVCGKKHKPINVMNAAKRFCGTYVCSCCMNPLSWHIVHVSEEQYKENIKKSIEAMIKSGDGLFKIKNGGNMNKDIYFMAWYAPMGQLQTVGNKKGFHSKVGKIIKEDETKIEYRLVGENGLRKLNKNCLNVFQDFGTSVIGIYDMELKDEHALKLISEVLKERIKETDLIITEVVNKRDDIKRDEYWKKELLLKNE